MRPLVTILLCCLSFVFIPMARAQSCPDLSSLNMPDNAFQHAGKTGAKALDVLSILRSDLDQAGKLTCLATRGKRSRLPATSNADEPLTSIEDQFIVNGVWMKEFLSEFTYNANDDEFPATASLYNYSPTAGDWELESMQFYNFSNDGNRLEIVFQESDGTALENALRLTTELDEFENLILLQQDMFENDAWVTYFVSMATVENGLIITEETQAFDEDAGVLMPATHVSYSYDGDNRETEELVSFYNPDLSSFEVSQRTLTAYADMTITRTQQIALDAETWADFNQTTEYYNDQSLLIEEVNVSLLTGAPVNQSRTLFEYNAMQLAVSEIYQVPVGDTDWQNDDGFFTTYDADGDVLIDMYQVYNAAGKSAAWEDHSRSLYTYGAPTGNEKELPTNLAALALYPSPARNRVNIDLNLQQPAHLKVEVFNVLGQRVATLADQVTAAGPKQLIWQSARLPAGLYMVRFNLDEETMTRSLFLIK